METLQRCYRLPAIRDLVDPGEKEDLTREIYWSQYCDAEDNQWTISNNRPNHLFLLLRDIPCPSEFSAQEMEVAVRLSQWRNQEKKDPRVWGEVFSNATSLPSDFFSACVTTYGNFCCAVWWFVRDDAERELYTSLTRKVAQIATQRDLLPLATVPLMQAYESLLAGIILWGENPLCFTHPFRYGKVLQQSSAEDHATHANLTLLLSRQLHSSPKVEKASQTKNVIAMLWLRPSNPVSRDWDYLSEMHRRNIPVDVVSDWIRNAESVPHILEILRHLAQAQEGHPTIGPLWRTTAHDEAKDLHFVEALQTFDRLMGTDCTDDDHWMLVNLVCQDLESEPFADFDHYFTPNRLESLALLKDDCLRVLVDCARGSEFLRPVFVPKPYGDARRKSLGRVAKYVHKRFSTISPTVLEFQASLWPMTSPERSLLDEAMQDAATFVSFHHISVI